MEMTVHGQGCASKGYSNNKASKELKGIVSRPTEKKPKVEKNVSERKVWVGLLPDGVNCRKTQRRQIKCSKYLYLQNNSNPFLEKEG